MNGIKFTDFESMANEMNTPVSRTVSQVTGRRVDKTLRDLGCGKVLVQFEGRHGIAIANKVDLKTVEVRD